MKVDNPFTLTFGKQPVEYIARRDDMLGDYVYQKVWESLSMNDKKIVLAFSDAPMRTQGICRGYMTINNNLEGRYARQNHSVL